MKISTRLKFNALLFAVVIFIISLFFALVFRLQREAFETSMVADSLVKDSYELDSLSNRYLRHPGDRPKEQWMLVYRDLEKNLKSNVHARHGRTVIIGRMNQNLVDIKELFDSLVAENENSGPAVRAPSGNAFTARQARITDLIIKRVRDLTLEAGRMAAMMNDQVLTINREITVFAPVAAALLTMFAVWFSLRMGRSISAGIGKLSAGAEAVGSGNLDYRIGHDAPDELGLLSRTFDDMTESLKKITVSRDELAREIAERRRAEEALRRSEAILKQAGQMARLGAWEIEFQGSDPDDNLHWSDEVFRIFGYQPGTVEVSNELFFERVHPDDRGRVVTAVSNAIAEKRPYSIEHRITRPDGSERIVYEHAEIIFENGGRPVRMIGAMQDITDRKKIEEALKQNERFLQTIIETAPACVKLVGADGTLQMMNRAGLGIIGADAFDQVQGKSIYALVASPYRRAFIDLTGKVFEGGSGTLEFEAIDLKGRHIWLNTHAVPLLDNAGDVTALLGITVDVTERKKAEFALKRVSRQNELLLENAGEGIFGLDLEGNVTFVNAVAAHMLGYERQELMGSQSHRTWHHTRQDGSSYPSAECPVYAAYKEGTIHSGEETFWKKDGSPFPVDFTSRPLYEGEKIAGAVVVYRDISERKRAEEELREREERFRAVYEQAAIGIELMDFTGTYSRGNGKLSRMLGYSGEELQRMTFAQITHPDDLQNELPLIDQLVSGLIPSYSIEKRYIHENGSEIWSRVTSSIARTSKPYRISIIEDITERKRAEEELKKLLADLERSNKELEQFAYVASHDLQEPLRMVASYAQLLEKRYKGRLDEKADKYIFFAVDGVKRMQKLIDGLLAYSRVARGAVFRRVDAGHAFDQAILNLSVAVRESGAVIRREEQLPVVLGDETQLIQLFQNLIGNAIKFGKPGVAPEVNVSVKRRRTEWVFSVRDNGIGLDPQYSRRIFLIFQRLHSRDEFPGTGIGLALCKRIVERHHGRIWVESEPGNGSAFFFTMPAIELSSSARSSIDLSLSDTPSPSGGRTG